MTHSASAPMRVNVLDSANKKTYLEPGEVAVWRWLGLNRFFPPIMQEVSQSVLRGCASVSALLCRMKLFSIVHRIIKRVVSIRRPSLFDRLLTSLPRSFIQDTDSILPGSRQRPTSTTTRPSLISIPTPRSRIPHDSAKQQSSPGDQHRVLEATKNADLLGSAARSATQGHTHEKRCRDLVCPSGRDENLRR